MVVIIITNLVSYHSVTLDTKIFFLLVINVILCLVVAALKCNFHHKINKIGKRTVLSGVVVVTSSGTVMKTKRREVGNLKEENYPNTVDQV